MMLIVSLPPVHQETLLADIVAHPFVGAVRYNTGMDSAYSPQETLARILEHTRRHAKPLYVDLKGRQLRVVEWATLPYGPIVLNHRIKVELPAKVFFRGDDSCVLQEVVDGNKIYTDPLPAHPVGRGQAVNILAKSIEIEGNLTEGDHEYIKAAVEEGVAKFMLSFVEDLDYIREFEVALRGYAKGQGRVRGFELVLKIESERGVEFVKTLGRKWRAKYHLMAARDDLMIQIGGLNMLEALRVIIKCDPKAMCASRLLLGLEEAQEVTMADISDLRLMQDLGYERFMFSDGISRNHFYKAIEFWEKYMALYPA